MRSLMLVALAAEFAAGCKNDFSRPDRPPSLAGAQSFNVTGALNPDVTTSGQAFVLRVDPGAGSMILGTPGGAVNVPLVSDDGFSFRATGPVTLPIAGLGCDSRATYGDFHFNAAADLLSGAATGKAVISMGDTSFERTAQLTFSGVPDGTAPSILNSGVETDPLAALNFVASEPLPSGAQAQLVSPDERILLEPVAGAASATVGFRPPERALRYQTMYKLIIDGWTDLAGNPGVPPDGVVTNAPPPLIAADGFEGASGALAGATIADATTFPPISGEKSAMLGTPSQQVYPPQFARFTVRLAVAPGDTVVRFSLRQFGPGASLYGGSFNSQVRLAVPGGSIVPVSLANLPSSGTDTVLPSGTHVTVGNVTSIEAPLPSEVGDEVVFDFRAGIYTGACSLPVPVPAFQIDDLRVE